MQSPCTPMFRIGHFMMITVGGRMREMAFLDEMQGVFDKLPRPGDESPEKQ